MVQSWDGTTLRTIEGNTARLDGSSFAAVEDELDRTPQLTGNAGAARIHGIGRPSIVDLEVHRYRETPPP
jgi:hypothetical protein